jgi:transcriptional regulator with XRE-family HTH domain
MLTGFQLRIIRDRLGISQQESAGLVGKSLGWVRLLEGGGATADDSRDGYAAALLAVCEERGVKVHDITNANRRNGAK